MYIQEIYFTARFFSFIVIKKQFLPPRLESRSGEDSLASSTLSLVTDLETPRHEAGSYENIRYGNEGKD
jgi:hypothetical protein